MRYLADTNVVLRFANRQDPLHPTMRTAIQKLRRNKDQVCIVPQNCIEFWNVATRPATRNGYGLNITETDKALRLVERVFTMLPEHAAVYAEWRKLVQQFNVAGVQVHDARLVATMFVYNITHMLTVNITDFARYTSIGIVAVHPAQV